MKYGPEVDAAVAYWGPVLGVRIDQALVHAVIQKESSHGAVLETAESGGRFSYGPMMVLDTTAKAYGVADPSTLKDPATGIWYGVRNLGELLRQFPGDVARAVSAYNTGPAHAVRNASTGKFPNQPYVDAVLSFFSLYRGAVAGGASILLAAAVALGLWLRSKRRGQLRR